MEIESDVTWTENVYGEAPPGLQVRPVIGRQMMRGRVRIVIDVPAIARILGRKALTNKTKKSSDGHVTVRLLKPAKAEPLP